jgi:type II secretory pathway pseudopilin PulG
MARIAFPHFARTLLIVGILAALLATGLSPAAAAPVNSSKEIASKALSQAKALQADWGRCPTARPANALVQRASNAKGIATRARLAVKAVDAFEKVAAECIMPVDQPTIVVSPSEGPVPPA